MKECLTEMKLDGSVNTNMKTKMPSVVSDPKRPWRNSSVKFLGNPTGSVWLARKDVVYITEETKYRNQKVPLYEKILIECKGSGNWYEFSRKTNAFDISHSKLPSRDNLNGLHKSEMVVSNRIRLSFERIPTKTYIRNLTMIDEPLPMYQD